MQDDVCMLQMANGRLNFLSSSIHQSPMLCRKKSHGQLLAYQYTTRQSVAISAALFYDN